MFSYVWPTTLDPSVVGFDKGAGILALAVTSHPDFDDTPLYDENGDGDLKNDGDLWHSHWVVLKPDAACGKGALKVVDIPAGTTPALPKTWRGLPLLIDSPRYSPVFKDATLEVRVPFNDAGVLPDVGFDGVTAALRVNASMHSPLLCVAHVFKVASGSLSLPGKVGKWTLRRAPPQVGCAACQARSVGRQHCLHHRTGRHAVQFSLAVDHAVDVHIAPP
ncbi:hypothetical protein [Massilia violaceinigra]|uniref:hypothetical protein n=1 Tax=Massilia violaceinigra TaxID=2045208 RepID=UPI001E423DB6|nr:hypothetical protein [Massilia violaceinigra]